MLFGCLRSRRVNIIALTWTRLGTHLLAAHRMCSSSPGGASNKDSDGGDSSLDSDFFERFNTVIVTHPLLPSPRSLPTTAAEAIAFKGKMLRSFPSTHIRNVSIVAHVDHGKTTLTDALLRYSGLLPDGATGTYTDRLSVERERGITIKAQTCSVFLTRETAEGAREEFLVNLIDTPGHVDFQYEVSRSLRASEGAALLVDVSQGVEAQTMAQFYAALEQDLTIIPVLTKMDQVMSAETVERTLQQLEDTTGLLRREVLVTSAKRKRGLAEFFQTIVDHVPPAVGGKEGFSDMSQLPNMHPDGAERKAAEDALVPLRALLFDCWTAESGGLQIATAAESAGGSGGGGGGGGSGSGSVDASYGVPLQQEGVYGLVRIVDGTLTPGMSVTFFHSRKKYEVMEVGLLHPSLHPTAALTAGMVGYFFIPGLQKKDILVGDTICTVPARRYALAPLDGAAPAEEPGAGGRRLLVEPVKGFKLVQPVVFAGFYPDEGDMVSHLRLSVDRLCINDPSVTVETVQCQALGAGLQLGFLGLLHMQVFKDRLLAEFGQSVLITPPQVQYRYVPRGASEPVALSVDNWVWPHEGAESYLEPIVTATVITPMEYFNEINQLALGSYRGEQTEMRTIDDSRALVRYRMPLADLARGFFSNVKSRSRGYATLEYDDPVYEPADLVKVDIVINRARISALSLICPRHEANAAGKRILESLKANLLRSSVDLPLQAIIGTKIIARETVKAYRKDVTAKIHAGDISRKQKKWADQKKGKERMARRQVGTVTLDQSVLAAAMGATTAS